MKKQIDGLGFFSDVHEILPDSCISFFDPGCSRRKEPFQLWENMGIHSDVVVAHMIFEGAEAGTVEIDDHNFPAFGQIVVGLGQEVFPLRVDHGEGVGEQDDIGGRSPEDLRLQVVGLMVEYLGIRKMQQLFPGPIQHISRDVDTDQAGLGKDSGNVVQIEARSTANFGQSEGILVAKGNQFEYPQPSKKEGPTGSIVDARLELIVIFEALLLLDSSLGGS